MTAAEAKPSRLMPPGRMFLLLLAAAALTMALLTPVDREWTVRLKASEWRWLDALTADSLFEGERPGLGDLSIVLLVATAVLYVRAWRATAGPRLRACRPQIGFVLAGILLIGVLFVYPTKWTVGRARPGVVKKAPERFTPWYRFGSHFVTEGRYRGSFPSGHTAAAFTFMALAYGLHASSRRGVRAGAWATGAAALVVALAMSLGRVMGFAHWLSDCAFALWTSWLLLHALYHWGLHVPAAVAYTDRCGVPPPVPAWWELRIAWYWLWLTAAAAALCLALRAVLRGEALWLTLLVPVAAPLAWTAIRRLRRLGFGVCTPPWSEPPTPATAAAPGGAAA